MSVPTATAAFAALLLSRIASVDLGAAYEPGLLRFLLSLTESVSVLDEPVDAFVLRCIQWCHGDCVALSKLLDSSVPMNCSPVDFVAKLEVRDGRQSIEVLSTTCAVLCLYHSRKVSLLAHQARILILR
jgi:hypothetical protein